MFIFNERLIIYEKYLPKTENVGIHKWAAKKSTTNVREKLFEDSIIDMWLLGMSKILYWQGNSSFSYISKLIKNDPKTTVNWLKL